MNIIQPIQQFVAVRAAIIKDESLLVIRESSHYLGGNKHGQYDVPGGKVKVGESVHDALKREIMEEVGMNVTVGKPFFIGEWRPIIKGTQIQIIGIFFVCTTFDKDIHLSQDHDDFKWIKVKDLNSLIVTDPVPDAIQVLIKEELLT